ncbi:hypothetical protein MC885_001147 [Smutsia gigantea]|nr:hypothetical protein MC885_001147 [Smutsia gigantea]
MYVILLHLRNDHGTLVATPEYSTDLRDGTCHVDGQNPTDEVSDSMKLARVNWRTTVIMRQGTEVFGKMWVVKEPLHEKKSPAWSTMFESIMDQVMQFVEPSRQFVKDSIRLVKRCTKPDRKEFQKIAMATAIGFAIMGFIGFFVKLIHIPINNIIV